MTSRSTPNKRGASKSKASGKKRKVTIPGWIWLVTGLAVGFFAAFLMGLAPGAVDVRTAASPNPAPSADSDSEPNKPVFDFYTLLPESEVTLPEETVITPPKPVAPPKAKPKTTEQPAKVSSKPKRYLLQAGSFRNSKDADRLRAQLLLEGLSPKVEKVSVGGGENWYRVQLGPFQDQQSLKSTQSVLAAKKIDTLLLQMK